MDNNMQRFTPILCKKQQYNKVRDVIPTKVYV